MRSRTTSLICKCREWSTDGDDALRITVRVSGSGAPVRRPSVLTFTLSRAVRAHGPRQVESSETPDSLCVIEFRIRMKEDEAGAGGGDA